MKSRTTYKFLSAIKVIKENPTLKEAWELEEDESASALYEILQQHGYWWIISEQIWRSLGKPQISANGTNHQVRIPKKTAMLRIMAPATYIDDVIADLSQALYVIDYHIVNSRKYTQRNERMIAVYIRIVEN